MAAIFQTTFSIGLSWIEMYENFTKVFSYVSNKHGSDNDLAPTGRQAIIWTNDG